MKCQFCNNSDLKICIEDPKDFEYQKDCIANVYFCENCNLLTQFPLPSKKKIETFYDNDYQAYTTSKNFLLKYLSKIYFKFYKKKIKLNKGSNILDFGCGTGEILNNLIEDGYNNLFAFDYVKHDTLNKKILFFDNMDKLKTYKFDLIILNHVIEHVLDPRELLDFLHGMLKENGKIIGQTPNFDDFTFKLFKETWGLLHQPYHINIFNKKSLKKICNQMNLNIKISQALMPTGLSMSLENEIKKKLYLNHKGRLSFYPIILGFSFMLNLVFLIFNKEGSIINFEIKKINF